MADIFLIVDEKVNTLTIWESNNGTGDISIHLTHKYTNGDYGVKLSKKIKKELIKKLVANL